MSKWESAQAPWWRYSVPWQISIFLFKPTRSSKIPKVVLGDEPLPGTLVVDRYAGYNNPPCALQYCYEHLSREVEDLEKEFPDSDEIKSFASVMVRLLTEAMQLRNQPITDKVFYAKAAEVKDREIAAVKATAVHMGIRCIQDIFDENAYRMYHWAERTAEYLLKTTSLNETRAPL